MWLFQKIKKLDEEQVDPIGLAIFRILYSLVLLGEVIQLFYFRHLVYDKIPFVVPAEIHWAWPLGIWMVAIVCVLFGFYYRIAALVSYLLTVVCVATTSAYEYHMFYAYTGINFLLMLIPANRVWSLDSVRAKVSGAIARQEDLAQPKVSLWTYRVLVFVGIALVYFDSIFHKFASDIWMNGLGAWLPANLPMVTQSDTSLIWNSKFLALFSGYLTLIFEVVFIFCFWFRKCWLPLFLIGVGFHLGILVEFPIPFFALGFACLYLLLVPPELVQSLCGKLRSKKIFLSVFYDYECPLCRMTVAFLSCFDWLRRINFVQVQQVELRHVLLSEKSDEELFASMHAVTRDQRVVEGVNTYSQIFKQIPIFWPFQFFVSLDFSRSIYEWIAKNRGTERCTDESCDISYFSESKAPVRSGTKPLFPGLTLSNLRVLGWTVFVFACVFFQLCMILNSPLLNKFYSFLTIEDSSLVNVARKVSVKTRSIVQPVLGITYHGVFTDPHFEGYHHQVKIVHRATGEVVPVTTDSGAPGAYMLGPTWAKWSFRANGPTVSQEKISSGIRDFTSFWIYKNKLESRTENQFDLFVRYVDHPKGWERSYYARAMKTPWEKLGVATWSNDEFAIDIVVVEDVR